jgi:hypothetical protein
VNASPPHLDTAANQRIEVVVLAAIVTVAIVVLVRRKRLMERYAILWLFAAGLILLLGLWKGLLTKLSHLVGIYYPPSALFAAGFVVVLTLMVHFSAAISRLTDQNKRLAQRLALVEHEQRSQGKPGAPAQAATDASHPTAERIRR